MSASATADTTTKIITGVGGVECNEAASIEVETCVQWDSGGSFSDITCQSSSQSGVKKLDKTVQASCGLSVEGKLYRTRVTATVNGTKQPEKLSTEIACK